MVFSELRQTRAGKRIARIGGKTSSWEDTICSELSIVDKGRTLICVPVNALGGPLPNINWEDIGKTCVRPTDPRGLHTGFRSWRARDRS